jgi:hypothetical protein
MNIRVHVQFQSSREATSEDKERIKAGITKLINTYEDLVVGNISVEVL